MLHGPKRATAGLLWDKAELDPTMMPVQGGYSLVTDHAGAPLLIIRTTQVEVRPYGKVDADFAAAEGEGGRLAAILARCALGLLLAPLRRDGPRAERRHARHPRALCADLYRLDTHERRAIDPLSTVCSADA